MNTLFTPPMPELTDRQSLAWRMCAGEGATDEQVGVALHVARRPLPCTNCLMAIRCDYARDDGRAVLIALRKKGLLIRRRTGLWVHKDCGPCEQCSAAQAVLGDLPESF